MKKKPAGTTIRSIALGGALMFGVQHAAFAATEISSGMRWSRRSASA